MSTTNIPADLVALIAAQRTTPMSPTISEPEVPIDAGAYTITSDVEFGEPVLTVSEMVDQMVAMKAMIQADNDAVEMAQRDFVYGLFKRSMKFGFDQQEYHRAAQAELKTAAMRECVDCWRPFYSRSAANVVCLPCREASTAEFEGGL